MDLSGMDANALVAGDQAFQFIGTGNFTGDAGQLRYEIVNRNTYVYGDTNGDGTADFMIQLASSKALTSGDFIFYPAAAKAPDDSGSNQVSNFTASSVAIGTIETSDHGLAAGSRMELTGETREALEAVTSSSAHHSARDWALDKGPVAVVSSEAATPAAVAQGTEVPPLAAALVANGVAMPSAEMLQAISQGNGVEAQGTAEVARVVLDALADWDRGPNLDALLDAVAGQVAGTPALAQLGGHTGWPDGLMVAHEAFSMGAFVVHHDALPQA